MNINCETFLIKFEIEIEINFWKLDAVRQLNKLIGMITMNNLIFNFGVPTRDNLVPTSIFFIVSDFSFPSFICNLKSEIKVV